MDIRIEPGIAHGTVLLPPSKSLSHRALIAAALANGASRISPLTLSDDVMATVASLRALGADIRYDADTDAATVKGGLAYPDNAILSCGDSASTLRFLIPVALLPDKLIRFTRSAGLKLRPLHAYFDIFAQQPVSITESENDVMVRGPLQSGEFCVDCSVSSQYMTGLLFALPLLAGNSRVQPISAMVSKPYIDLTRKILISAGITTYEDGTGYRVPGNQRYQPFDIRLESDMSAAAYIDLLNLLGGKVHFENQNNCSEQGDSVYSIYYAALAEKNAALDISQCPDLAPALMVAAAFLNGGRLTGTGRLQFKESDRGRVMATELQKLGATVTVEDEEIIIGQIISPRSNAVLDSHGDHRIAMALAAAATIGGGTIRHAEAVTKSYPDFWQHYRNLGISCEPICGER